MATRADQGIVAIFELEVRRDSITAACSCGDLHIVHRHSQPAAALAEWMFDHSRCPEVEVCR